MSHFKEHILTLQIGHETNKILSYLWSSREMDLLNEEEKVIQNESCYHHINEKEELIPKCVMVDTQYNELRSQENSIDLNTLEETVPWAGSSTTIHRSTSTVSSSKSAYFSKTKFSSKSFLQIPPLPENDNSQWYYQRKVNSGIRDSTESVEETTLDSLRYFAEASDRVDGIDVYADLYGDCGYFTSQLLEKIRDDFGKGVSLPVWLLDHQKIYDYGSQGYRLAPIKISQLFSSSLVLSYSGLLESADLIIPLQIPNEPMITDLDDRLFHYRISGSVALETCLAFRRGFQSNAALLEGSSSSTTLSTKEWMHSVTSGFRLPIASMEAFLPALTHDVDMQQNYIFDCLHALKATSTTTEVMESFQNSFQYNPFMKSFALPSMKVIHDKLHYHRPHSNVISFRGIGGIDFVEQLYLSCLSSSYIITKCNAAVENISLRWNESTNYQPINVASDAFVAGSGIGTNSWIGDHIREETIAWYEEALSGITQYQKVDLEKEDLENKRELLLQLSEEYV